MKRLFQRPTTYLILAILLVFTILLASSGWPVQAAPDINKVYVSNVRSNTFVVSWTTDGASDGHVDYGTTTSLGSTASDTVTSTTTHYVTISGLSPSQQYYFQVRSGTDTDNNGGAYYQVTTGPALSPPGGGGLVTGVVEDSSTNEVPNAIVYIRLQDVDGSGSPGNSQWVTARTEGNGSWGVTLPGFRTSDFSAYFDYTAGDGGDKMRLNYQCGVLGNVGEDGDEWIINPIPDANPAAIDPEQACDNVPNAITLKSFTSESGTEVRWLPFLVLVGVLVLAAALVLRQRARQNMD
jgi:hypothetical protein